MNALASSLSQTGFDLSLSVLAFTGASGIGASASQGALSGAPGIGLTSTRRGSWMFAVGNDWDNATARVLGSGQTMVHQFLDTATGNTYWLQSQGVPLTLAAIIMGWMLFPHVPVPRQNLSQCPLYTLDRLGH